ncbi:MAG: folate family ECF transporter S component [Clostridiales bacterium]|nr:folate family ECF transporter S component [Clostridiales bacterium]
MKNNRFALVTITYIGAMVALQVVLGSIVQIPMLTKQINLGYLPVAVAGYLMGPIGGIAVGVLGDFLGAHLFPQGAYNALFTLTAAIVGFVYGWFLYPENQKWIGKITKTHTRALIVRVVTACVIAALVNLFMNTLWIQILYVPGKAYWALLLSRLVYVPVETPIAIILVTLCCSQMKRLPRMLLPDEIRKNIVEKQ